MPFDVRHGYAKERPRIYRIWESMRSRCNCTSNTHYSYYGGRGITVCRRWSKFENFLKDMGDSYRGDLTLDRINVNGNYTPSNCRWVTMKEQARNTRRASRVTYGGKVWNIADLAEHTGVGYDLLRRRVLALGWDINRAVSEPVKVYGKRYDSSD